MRIEYHSEPDSIGRCRFTIYWWSEYHPGDPAGEHRLAERAQEFFDDPLKYGFLPPVPGEVKP